jgi:Rrf2 family protein
VRISHKVDYGIRALAMLAEAQRDAPHTPVTSHELSEREQLPPKFFEDVLRQLRAAGLVRSTRGRGGGWVLARPAVTISAADVIRALEGPLASVRGVRPHELDLIGEREPFISLWVAVRAALRSVLENVSLSDLADGQLPEAIQAMVDDLSAWETREVNASASPPDHS